MDGGDRGEDGADSGIPVGQELPPLHCRLWCLDIVGIVHNEERRAHGLLSQRINTGLRNQFGERTLNEVISGERDELMTELRDQINTIAQQEFGIDVVDVRVNDLYSNREVLELIKSKVEVVVSIGLKSMEIVEVQVPLLGQEPGAK